LPRNLAPNFGQYTDESTARLSDQRKDHMSKQKKRSTKAAKPVIDIRDLKPVKNVKGGVTLSPIPITKPRDKAH